MASFTIDTTRPTVYVGTDGRPVNGFLVRITILPWGEARDLELPDDNPDTIKEAATAAIKNRAAMDKLSGVEVELDE